MAPTARRKPKKFILVALIICAAVSMVSLQHLWNAGAFAELKPHAPDCAPIAGIVGGEDLVISDAGFALVSSLDRRVQAYGTKWQQGAIVGFSVHEQPPTPRRLTDDFSAEFYPRGLALYEAADESRLMVLNYRPDGYYVEIFAWHDERLVHLESLQSPLLNQPGHIFAVGPRQFYVSNERGLYTSTGHIIEDSLNLRQASLVYFDGQEFQVAAKKLAYPGGIFVQGDRLFVSELNGKNVSIYQREAATADLKLLTRIPLPSFANHVKADADGSLWVTAHPQMLQYQSHAMDPAQITAPSQVFELRPEALGSLRYSVHEYLLTTSGPLSGASVAAPYANHLLLGAAFEDKLLWCPKKAPRLTQTPDSRGSDHSF